MRPTPLKFSTARRIVGPTLFAVQLLPAMVSLLWAQVSTGDSPTHPNLAGMTSKQRYEALKFTTPAYRREALRLVIEEANRVAREVQLPEKLPITQSDLLEAYISPPRMSQALGIFGTVTTSNYTYYVSVANKFSFLTKRNLESDYEKIKAHVPLAHKPDQHKRSLSTRDPDSHRRFDGRKGTPTRLHGENPRLNPRRPKRQTLRADLLDCLGKQASRRRRHRHGQWCLN